MSPRIAALLAGLDAEIDAAEAITAGLRRERAEILNAFAPPLPSIADGVRSRCWEHRPRRGAEMAGPPIARERRPRAAGEEERLFPGNGYRTQADRLGIGSAGDNGGIWLTWDELCRMQPAKQEQA